MSEKCDFRVADKIYDLTQFNEVCLDIGCGAGHIAPHVFKVPFVILLAQLLILFTNGLLYSNRLYFSGKRWLSNPGRHERRNGGSIEDFRGSAYTQVRIRLIS